MAKFSVPNAPDVAYLDQAEPDDFDYQALGNRRTGIISGGNVTAPGGSSVQVTAGVAIINDLPVSFNAGTVAVTAGGASPRFDIIAVSSNGVLTNIPGTESTNALFATFDFDQFAPLAVVYMPPGMQSVLASYIAFKATTMQASFQRSYPSVGSTFLHSWARNSSTSHFFAWADGTLVWGSNVLSRIGNAAMQWVTNLTMRSPTGGVDPLLTLQETSSSPTDHRLLRVLDSAGTNELAYINGKGFLYADNIMSGTVADPNNVVRGDKGDIYIARSNGGTSTGIWQKGGSNGTTVGWVSFKVYDPNDSALPTGTIIQSLSATAPAGFIAANGQWINKSGTTAELAAMIGSRYGSTASQVQMPDLNGKVLADAGAGLAPWDDVGVGSYRLTEANLPPHNHNVNDPGHDHPEAGPHAYVAPYWAHNNRHIVPSSGNYEHIYTESSDFNRNSRTGITLGNTGSGTPVDMHQPTHTVNFYVKL